MVWLVPAMIYNDRANGLLFDFIPVDNCQVNEIFGSVAKRTNAGCFIRKDLWWYWPMPLKIAA